MLKVALLTAEKVLIFVIRWLNSFAVKLNFIVVSVTIKIREDDFGGVGVNKKKYMYIQNFDLKTRRKSLIQNNVWIGW